jgi:OOP family OmpA-OmpF porin
MRSAALAAAAAPAAIVLCVAGAAAADEPSLDLRGWHASADPEAGTTLEPASAPDTGEWNVGLRAHWAYRPIELFVENPDGTRTEVVPVEHQVTADLVAGVGLWRRLFLGLDIPYVVAQTGDEVEDPGIAQALGTTRAPLVALGDVGLSAKIILMPADEEEFGGFGVAALQRFSLPTGDEGSFRGEGEPTSESRLLVEWRSAPLSALVGGGIKFRFDKKESFYCLGEQHTEDGRCPSRFGHELPIAVGAVLRPSGLGIDDGGRTSLHGELRTYLPVSPIGPLEHEEVAGAFGSLAARVRVRDISLFGGVEVAFTDGIGNAPVRVSLGVDFAPRDHDPDGDGMEEDRDQCRELPEDHDGFEDDDGCPEVDDDQDRVPDGEDRCPREAAPGTPDGCPPVVVAPAAPSPAPPGPSLTEPVAPPPPAPAPPVAPAPAPRAAAGDKDGDTFPDADDKCPEAAETFEGKTDDDGCPEPPPATGKAPKPLAEMVTKDGATTLTLHGVLAFDKADAVEKASDPMLRAIAALAKKDPAARVLVGARPSPARTEQAQTRAFAVAQKLRGWIGRDDAVKVVDWDQVKKASLAEVYGVGIVLGK